LVHETLTMRSGTRSSLYTPPTRQRNTRTYDNYDAIEVGITKEIPTDYYGVMGVPITFLDKYSPEQFEIVGTLESNDPKNSYRTRVYTSKECRDAIPETVRQNLVFTTSTHLESLRASRSSSAS